MEKSLDYHLYSFHNILSITSLQELNSTPFTQPADFTTLHKHYGGVMGVGVNVVLPLRKQQR